MSAAEVTPTAQMFGQDTAGPISQPLIATAATSTAAGNVVAVTGGPDIGKYPKVLPGGILEPQIAPIS